LAALRRPISVSGGDRHRDKVAGWLGKGRRKRKSMGRQREKVRAEGAVVTNMR
jgi:hypothetical protein